MCSITGSKSLNRLKELTKLNEYRGTHSHSVFAFAKHPGQGCGIHIVYAFKDLGGIDWENTQPTSAKHLGESDENVYWVAHQQAPTTEAKDLDSVHPAASAGRLLWHNGIIKEKEVKRLQELYGNDTSWDTSLLLSHINTTGNVQDIDGTFACFLFAEGLKVFRNEISPLFYNEAGDLSSTKFEGSQPLPPNKMFSFDPWSDVLLTQTNEFVTKENPYFFG